MQFAPPGAPDPLACASDAACVAGPLVDPNNGCCDSGVALGVFNKDYLEWRATWVREQCREVKCPPQPPPAPPMACALEGRCVSGRCQHRCPPPGPPFVAERTTLPAEVARAVGRSEDPVPWSPSAVDLDAADRLLVACVPTLEPAVADHAEARSKIVAGLAEYRRQFVPFRDSQGHRLLWINLFRDRAGDHHPDWRTELVSVRGGGHGYFSILVDLDGGRCSDLRINSPR